MTNCTLSSGCNAIRLGVGEGRIHDAVFSNLVIYDSPNAFNIVSGYTRTERGTDIFRIRFSNIIANADRLMKIHHMRGDEGIIRDLIFDGISGTARTDSRIWAKEAHPFKGIILRNVDIESGFECINASVKVEGGHFKKHEIPSKTLKERRWNIENEKKLLY